MRRFVRHPTNIPVDVTAKPQADAARQDSALTNLSQTGMACQVPTELPIGTVVNIEIPSVSPPYQGQGEIVWCQQKGEHFEVGLRFTDKEEAFKARMVQQVCQIERYRQNMLVQEGRELDSEQAAREWIARYADTFSPV